jgi:hypothetical protein
LIGSDNLTIVIGSLLLGCKTSPVCPSTGLSERLLRPVSSSTSRSCAAGYFFLGSMPTDNQPIELNGAIYALYGILKIVVASGAEAELGALFLNIKDGVILRLILTELGHKQPPTPVHCDNKTATGIANDTVKKKRSRSMEMRFFWIDDQAKRQLFKVYRHPGQENLVDYFTKHFNAKHHQAVRQWYLHAREPPVAYHEQQHLALCEGVLELSPMGMSDQHLCQGYLTLESHEG